MLPKIIGKQERLWGGAAVLAFLPFFHMFSVSSSSFTLSIFWHTYPSHPFSLSPSLRISFSILFVHMICIPTSSSFLNDLVSSTYFYTSSSQALLAWMWVSLGSPSSFLLWSTFSIVQNSPSEVPASFGKLLAILRLDLGSNPGYLCWVEETNPLYFACENTVLKAISSIFWYFSSIVKRNMCLARPYLLICDALPLCLLIYLCFKLIDDTKRQQSQEQRGAKGLEELRELNQFRIRSKVWFVSNLRSQPPTLISLSACLSIPIPSS